METRMIKLSSLVPNEGQIAGLPKNPRKWTSGMVDKLKQSITETPELLEARGILVYPHEGKYIVLGGNMRLQACKELKQKEVPCIVVPESTSTDKLKEIVIKDNGSFGEWDFSMLAQDWGDLNLDDWGVAGWDEHVQTDEFDGKEAEDDNFDETKEEIPTRCHEGEIWQLGKHRLLCGDSTKVLNVNNLMGGALAKLLLTDPPYNVDYEGKTKDKLKISNDKMSQDAFESFLCDAFSAANEALAPGAAVYIWHASTYADEFIRAFRQNWEYKQLLIWAKNAFVMGRQDYQQQHEPCLYGWKGGAAHYFTPERTHSTVIQEKRPQRNDLHPTMKPIQLMGRLIKNSTRTGEPVLDTFGGSGSTLIACEQLGRVAYTMELDPHYCDVILARWEKLTGQTAQLISGASSRTQQ